MSRDPVVVVPGDLDVEDRIAGPVTFRMAAWLAASAAGVAVVAASRGAVATTALGVLLVVVGITGAWWRPGGRPVAAWLGPLLAYRKRRQSYVTTADLDDAPAPEVAPEPETTVEPETTDVRVPPRAVPMRWHGRALAGVLTGVVVLAAVAAFAASRGGTPPRTVPATEVVAPEPTVNPPVVVLVPIDPFTGWEVGGDVDPLCGC
ncbi:MAG TPA: hypothetical protein VGX28_12855 [Frankiaceae bacterium]|jgi:hypothetical protein|nr:hypothetical protein [Frankiaceae bacterium]